MTLIESHFGEKDLALNHRTLQYSGPFQAERLLTVLRHAIEARGYSQREKKYEEQVGSSARNVFFDLRPYKDKTSFVSLMIKIKVNLRNMGHVEFSKDGLPLEMEAGDVEIIFDAWVLGDRAERWKQKPFVEFLKGVTDRFFVGFKKEGKLKGEVRSDAAFIYGKAREYLKEFTIQQERGELPQFEDIQKGVAKDVKKSTKQSSRDSKALKKLLAKDS